MKVRQRGQAAYLAPVKWLFLTLLCWVTPGLRAQFVVIDSIALLGNAKTRRATILRELDVHRGDTLRLDTLPARLRRNEELLMNTGLFNRVKFNLKNWDTTTARGTLVAELEEGWYLFPVPIFSLADRNFNVWWEAFDASLDRVNYGLNLYHSNPTGRRDPLSASVQFGFTQRYRLEYERPFIDRKQVVGLVAVLEYNRQRELNYATLAGSQAFFRGEERILLRRTKAEVGFRYRPRLLDFQEIRLGFHQRRIDGQVRTELNPNYLGGAERLRYFSLAYISEGNYTNIQPYPTKGYAWKAQLEKRGLGLFDEANQFFLSGRYGHYFSWDKKSSVELIGAGRYQFTRRFQPYILRRGLGYNDDYLRGYELYVIDGQDYLYGKFSFRYELLNRDFNLGKLMLIEQFRRLPVKLYAKFNNDLGYVWDNFATPDNFLANELLWGYGPALDIVVYYSYVFQIEYSYNRLGEKGIYLHFGAAF